MVVLRAKLFGSSNLGVYLKPVGKYLLAPIGARRLINDEASSIGLEVVELSIYDSKMLGIFVVGNSRSLLVPPIISDFELEKLKNSLDLEVHVLPSTKLTALGNDIVANDYGAIVHPAFSDEEVSLISRYLGVDVLRGKIGGMPIVGSLVVVNNRGCLTSPAADDVELKGLSDLLQVECERGTVNNGVGYVKLGLVASDKGAIVGYPTTPREIENLSEALKIEP
ncbi:MAG: translation initiation factor IF-6 [Thermoproteota archaeon]|nr:translation initiation factor IF-6 [Candidatus Korarchaeota archaeon]RLG43058.1 MAG: translation initiation factor IF-6 [Candidatus Korarchaeota archaeon]